MVDRFSPPLPVIASVWDGIRITWLTLPLCDRDDLVNLGLSVPKHVYQRPHPFSRKLVVKELGHFTVSIYSIFASFVHREFHSVAPHLLQLGPGQRRTLSDRPNMKASRTPVKITNSIQNSRNGRRVLTGTGFVLTIMMVIQSTGGTRTHRNANDGRGWYRSTGLGDLFCLSWMSPNYGSSLSLPAFAWALLVDGSTYWSCGEHLFLSTGTRSYMNILEVIRSSGGEV